MQTHAAYGDRGLAIIILGSSSAGLGSSSAGLGSSSAGLGSSFALVLSEATGCDPSALSCSYQPNKSS